MSDVTIGSSASDEVIVVVNPAASAVVINTAKNDTLTYRNEALVAKTASETAQTAAELAETNAETAETNTLTSASNANTSANTASTHATTSTTQAGIATTQASNANASAIASASSASDSDSSATASSGSASSANISAVNALASEQAAAISESEAADSASQANISRIATDNRWGEFNGIWLGKFITAEMPTVSVDVGSMAYDSTLNSFRTWNGLVWSEASAGDSITDVTSTRVGDTVTVKVYLEGALIESFDIVDGAQGIQGIQGIQGVQGLQGIQGIQGIAGVEAYTDAEIKTKYELNADTNAFTDNNELLQGFFNGATIDNVEGTITSDGITVTASVQKLGGGDVRYKTSTGFKILDCTPAQTIALTAGTDSVPVKNYMYVDVATNLMAVSTTGFPLVEYVPLATTIIGSAAHVQSEGTYATHQWSDHVFTLDDNGHLTHLNQWIRSQSATWVSGVAPSFTGSGTATVEMSLASGVMFQLHKHATEAIVSPAGFHVYNDFTTPYNHITNLASIVADSTGTALGSKYYALTVWYAYSELTGDSKLMVNLPSGAYNSEADVRQDSSKYTDFSIPVDYRGTAILLHRLICRISGGLLTIYAGAGDDLRGTLPNTASGSSTSVGSTFLDSTFRIENIADTTKQIALDASLITTATTRTLTARDASGTIALAEDIGVTVQGYDILLNNTITEW